MGVEFDAADFRQRHLLCGFAGDHVEAMISAIKARNRLHDAFCAAHEGDPEPQTVAAARELFIEALVELAEWRHLGVWPSDGRFEPRSLVLDMADWADFKACKRQCWLEAVIGELTADQERELAGEADHRAQVRAAAHEARQISKAMGETPAPAAAEPSRGRASALRL